MIFLARSMDSSSYSRSRKWTDEEAVKSTFTSISPQLGASSVVFMTSILTEERMSVPPSTGRTLAEPGHCGMMLVSNSSFLGIGKE